MRARTVLTEVQLRRAAARELQRSDRCGSDLSLIRFELPAGAEARPGALQELLDAVLHRVRESDEVGWLAPGTLGILLPETSGEGAWQLAEDLLLHDASRLLREARLLVQGYSGPAPARAESLHEQPAST